MNRTPEHQEALRALRECEEARQQSETAAGQLSSASLEIRAEDTEQLADFKKANKAMIIFINKIAESQSKFAPEARKLLGHS